MTGGLRGKWIAICLGLLAGLLVNHWWSRMRPVWTVTTELPIRCWYAVPNEQTIVTVHGPNAPPDNTINPSSRECYTEKPVIVHWDLSTGKKLKEIAVVTDGLPQGYRLYVRDLRHLVWEFQPSNKAWSTICPPAGSTSTRAGGKLLILQSMISIRFRQFDPSHPTALFRPAIGAYPYVHERRRT